MKKFSKLNKTKKGVIVLAAISAVTVSVLGLHVLTGAYGRDSNWDVYQSSKLAEVNLDHLLSKTVKNNPEQKGEKNNMHKVKEYMDLYNRDYNSYTVVDSITNGLPIGDRGNPEIPSDPSIKNPNLYADTTIFTDSNGQKKASGWYDSVYGPFLDAEVSNDRGSQESDSAEFAKILFPKGSDRVYVATDEPQYYLRDAKSTATLYGGKYPILISESGSYGSLSVNLETLKAKHAIFLGGTGSNKGPATFDSLTGVGTTGTDMARIGGTDASQTARFMKQLPSDVYDNPTQPQNNLDGKYTLVADSSVSSSTLSSIEVKLKSNDFTGAVKLALANKIGDATPHQESNIQSGTPALTIGGFDKDNPPTGDAKKDKLKEKYLKVYLCTPSTGQLVLQYFESGFKFVPTTPNTGNVKLTVDVSPKDAGTINLDGKTSDSSGTINGSKTLKDGTASFNVKQTPNTKAPAESHWKFDHWGVLDGDKVTPDNNGNLSITKDTTIVAYYKLIFDGKDKIYPDEKSHLKIKASVDAAWYREGEEHKSSDKGATIAKEGQLVTFTVKTDVSDYRYPITDSRGWQDAHTPSYVYYSKDGFTGILFGKGEESHDFGHWHHSRHSSHWVSHWKYRQDYKGTVYRKPVQYFSPTELRLYFPDGIVNTDPTGLNPSIKDDLNVDPTTPYMEHYMTSAPTYTYSRTIDSTYGQVWKHNTEKVEFYVHVTTPVTIKQLKNGDTERIREPYKIKVEAIEPSGIKKSCYVDLDIEGNIYQGIYTTPVN